MQLIQAPGEIPLERPVSVFLAGGITNCIDWQDEVAEGLKDVDCMLLNPRRNDFDVLDPASAKAQIEWEFNAISLCDIFSMWFCAGPSPQPICMYELGMQMGQRLSSPSGRTRKQIVIGIEPGYIREQDVRIQVGLVSYSLASHISSSLKAHIQNIRAAVWKMSYLLSNGNGGKG